MIGQPEQFSWSRIWEWCLLKSRMQEDFLADSLLSVHRSEISFDRHSFSAIVNPFTQIDFLNSIETFFNFFLSCCLWARPTLNVERHDLHFFKFRNSRNPCRHSLLPVGISGMPQFANAQHILHHNFLLKSVLDLSSTDHSIVYRHLEPSGKSLMMLRVSNVQQSIKDY